MGYERVRHYRGGLEDWTERGLPLASGGAPKVAARGGPRRGSRPLRLLEDVAELSLGRLLLVWGGLIGLFGVLYWAAELLGSGLRSSGESIGMGMDAAISALYFSFVTALSIGYGDLVPVGPVRALAVLEGFLGLLLFGAVVSKLVSRRQEELTADLHRLAFEDRLGRVRTNLHLVVSDLQGIAALCQDPSANRGRVRSRLEGAVSVFEGELRAVHDLLYRPESTPDAHVLEPILARVASGLGELSDLLLCAPDERSAVLDANLRAMARLAEEICGECVPRELAPELKEWMDAIRERARKLG